MFAMGRSMTNSALNSRLGCPLRVLLLGALITLLPTLALAQPRTGQVAAGADIGMFFPSDDRLQAGLMADGFIEFYPAPRLGIRPIITAIRSGYDRFDDDDERQLRLGVDVIYNWEGGRIHPFFGGGFGVHFLRFYRGGNNEGPNDTNFGTNLLGGLEIFMNREWTVKLEGRYQWVQDRPNLDPDGFGALIGFKRYF
jgi:opacity protein-like surface antigen